ncbi:OmpA family protein [Achromobacter xylosoxidans]
MIKRLAAILNKNDYQVSVEGHSDPVPIQTRQFASNWELSSSRATSVLRELVRDGVAGSRLRAVGYAETRPIESNDTPAGRAANRRVELIMDITAPAKPAQAEAKGTRASRPAPPTARPAPRAGRRQVLTRQRPPRTGRGRFCLTADVKQT